MKKGLFRRKGFWIFRTGNLLILAYYVETIRTWKKNEITINKINSKKQNTSKLELTFILKPKFIYLLKVLLLTIMIYISYLPWGYHTSKIFLLKLCKYILLVMKSWELFLWCFADKEGQRRNFPPIIVKTKGSILTTEIRDTVLASCHRCATNLFPDNFRKKDLLAILFHDSKGWKCFPFFLREPVIDIGWVSLLFIILLFNIKLSFLFNFPWTLHGFFLNDLL